MFWKQLFATKSLEMLQAEAEGDNRLRRILGPVGLTSLGIGAIIGAGIFVMTGRAAAQDAGPAILLSYVVAGMGCLFAALCYAEFAAMAPVAGSAYTYAYATLGEMMAWIIGWDLVLEYAMACACVSSAWSKYFNEFLRNCNLPVVPEFLCSDPFSHSGAWFNLPALLITLLVTVILVIGIRESAGTNAVLVGVKVGVVLFVIGVGMFFIHPEFWTSIPATDRIRPDDLLIKQMAKEEVEEGGKLTQEETEARLQSISKRLHEAVDTGTKLPPEEAKAKADAIMRQVRWLLKETAKLPKYEAEARTRELANQLEATMKIERRIKETGEDEKQATAAVTEKLLPTIKERDKGAIEDTIKKLEAEHAVVVLEDKDKAKEISVTVAEAKEELKNLNERQELELPQSEEEKALIAKLAASVTKEADKEVTKKWGMLGYLGLNTVLSKIDDKVRSPFAPYGLAGIIFGASIVFFAYIGFDAISTHSEEAAKPQRDVPIAILASLVICTVLYIGVAAVITGMVKYPEIDQETAVASAFRQLADRAGIPSLKYAALLIATGALAGMTSVLLITFLSQARIFLAMARDRLVPPAVFGAIHPRFRTPHISTMLTGGIISVVSAFTPISALEEMVNIGTLMAFVIVCAAVLILRVKRPNAKRPFRSPVIWFVAPAGILVNLLMMLFLPPITWMRLAGWLVLGLFIYGFYGMRNSVIGQGMRGLIPSFAGHGAPPNGDAKPLPDGDKILDKSVLMADPRATDPS